MRRRELIAIFGSALVAWPFVGRAQQTAETRRIGVLMAYPESDADAKRWVAAFLEGLQQLGWTEDGNIRIDIRWLTANSGSVEHLAKEVVALQPELVLSSNTSSTAALLRETRTIPIIFAISADPVGSGFVTSLARPAECWHERRKASPFRSRSIPTCSGMPAVSGSPMPGTTRGRFSTTSATGRFSIQ